MPMKGAMKQGPTDNVDDIMEYIKQLEAEGKSPEEAKAMGLAKMMQEEEMSGEPAVPVKEPVAVSVPAEESDPEMDEIMAIAKAKKASGGKMKPNFKPLDEDELE